MGLRPTRVYPLRVAIGLGTAEREQALLPALTESGDILIMARCLAAEQLLEAAQSGTIDVLLVTSDLHRLSHAMLGELVRTRVPLVMLTTRPDGEPWASLQGTVLSLDASAEVVFDALLTLASGGGSAVRAGQQGLAGAHERPGSAEQVPTAGASSEPTAVAMTERKIIAIGGGPGSPGRTTVALNLAVALGTVAPTVLVDADLAHPSIGGWLDADITRNLSVLARTEPATPREWERAIEQETQPLHQRSPHGVLLCGVPKPELRSTISIRFFERLLTELRQRYRYVIVDVGVEVMGVEGAVHRTALALAQQVLLVTSADLLGLHGARAAIGLWQAHIGLGRDQLAMAINKHDRRYHYGRAEIEWALQVPVAAVVPYDYRSLQRALAAQRPVLVQRSSKAADALLDLATRLHAGKITLPQATAPPARGRWLARLALFRIGPRPHNAASVITKGADDHGDAVAVHDRPSSRRHRPRGGARAPRGGSGSGRATAR